MQAGEPNKEIINMAAISTRMSFSQRPTSHLLIESQTLQFDLGMTLNSFMTLTLDKSNQVKVMSR